MGKSVKAVIFDLDGVITDTAEFHYLAWKKLSEDLGIPFTREFNEELKGISRLESLGKILEASGRKDEFTEKEKLVFAQQKNNHYAELIKGITPADILPGIQELIVQIKDHGLKLGLASVSKNAFTVMDRLGLTDQFNTIIDASTIRNGKPDPEIFLRAADVLGVEPVHCIGIEDAAAGIEAIKAAGMFAIGIGDKKVLGKAEVVYESTSHLSLKGIINEYRKA